MVDRFRPGGSVRELFVESRVGSESGDGFDLVVLAPVHDLGLGVVAVGTEHDGHAGEAQQVLGRGGVLEARHGRLAGQRRAIGLASGGEFEQRVAAHRVAVIAILVSGEDLEDALGDQFDGGMRVALAGILEALGERLDLAGHAGVLHEQKQPGVAGDLRLVEADAQFLSIRCLEKKRLGGNVLLGRERVLFFHTTLIINVLKLFPPFFFLFS